MEAIINVLHQADALAIDILLIIVYHMSVP
jgi:hypothetical protein